MCRQVVALLVAAVGTRRCRRRNNHLAGLRLFRILFRGLSYFLVKDHAAEAILAKVVALVHCGIVQAFSWRGEAR